MNRTGRWNRCKAGWAARTTYSRPVWQKWRSVNFFLSSGPSQPPATARGHASVRLWAFSLSLSLSLSLSHNESRDGNPLRARSLSLSLSHARAHVNRPRTLSAECQCRGTKTCNESRLGNAHGEILSHLTPSSCIRACLARTETSR